RDVVVEDRREPGVDRALEIIRLEARRVLNIGDVQRPLLDEDLERARLTWNGSETDLGVGAGNPLRDVAVRPNDAQLERLRPIAALRPEVPQRMRLEFAVHRNAAR